MHPKFRVLVHCPLGLCQRVIRNSQIACNRTIHLNFLGDKFQLLGICCSRLNLEKTTNFLFGSGLNWTHFEWFGGITPVNNIRVFFSVRVFFYKHSRITGQQRKGKGISLTSHYHFHPLCRYLDNSREITAESSPLHIASSQERTGNLWFPIASH